MGQTMVRPLRKGGEDEAEDGKEQAEERGADEAGALLDFGGLLGEVFEDGGVAQAGTVIDVGGGHGVETFLPQGS